MAGLPLSFPSCFGLWSACRVPGASWPSFEEFGNSRIVVHSRKIADSHLILLYLLRLCKLCPEVLEGHRGGLIELA